MYNVVKSVIESKDYDLAKIMNKIEALWVKGKLTDKQKDELQGMARISARAVNSVDILAKLNELEMRIKALETAQPKEEQTEEVVAEFVVGKWYFKGDKVKFDGKTYECIAPVGDTCVWSPKDFPAYWTEI